MAFDQYLPLHRWRSTNEALRRCLFLIVLLVPMAAVAAYTVQVSRECKFRHGPVSSGFSDGLDIDRTTCPLIPGRLNLVWVAHGVRFEWQ